MATCGETRVVKALLVLGLLIREVLITLESKGERLMKGRSKGAACTQSSKPLLTVGAALQGLTQDLPRRSLPSSGLSRLMGHLSEVDLHQEALCGATLAASHANHRIREAIINYLAGEGHGALQLLGCTGPETQRGLLGGCAAHRCWAMLSVGRGPGDGGEVKLKVNTGTRTNGENPMGNIFRLEIGRKCTEDGRIGKRVKPLQWRDALGDSSSLLRAGNGYCLIIHLLVDGIKMQIFALTNCIWPWGPAE